MSILKKAKLKKIFKEERLSFGDIILIKKTHLSYYPRRRFFSGIDSIKPCQPKSSFKKRVHKKINFKNIFLIVFLILIVSGLGFLGGASAKFLKSKLNVLQVFKQGKYLVLFQNNSEMRPSGGFIGSFAVVDFDNYKIKNINFNTNIYKLDNPFQKENNIAPPEPLGDTAVKGWSLRDSNFKVNFPQAAQDIEWFYTKESGQSVDGVIALNASVISDLIKLTGPIELTQYKTTLSSDNFFEELAQKIEKEYWYDQDNWKINEPKTILKDLMPLLALRAKDISKIKLLELVYQELEQKQILFYANDRNLQSKISESGWAGDLKPSSSDYLYINNANLVDNRKNIGAKSSLKIKENVNYQVKEEKGKLIAQLNLTRSHTGSYTWPDGINRNYTRILVPMGAELISSQLNGRDIIVAQNEESGKTVFALWIVTKPETSNVVNLTYRLPINKNNYSLLVQKQPGNLGDKFEASFNNKMLFNGVLDRDKDIKL